jgi:hypothetical protein
MRSGRRRVWWKSYTKSIDEWNNRNPCKTLRIRKKFERSAARAQYPSKNNVQSTRNELEYVQGPVGIRSGFMKSSRRPSAECAMRISMRRSRVASCFALMTIDVVSRR